MSNWILGAFAAAFLAWLLGVGPRRAAPAPEDDLATPVDEDELEAAEREVRDDGTAKPIGEALAGEEGADDDDWGPGTGGRSNLPGIM
ncbi:MAG: hypothetical protein ABJC19_08540 [Gemmatimonadota bacterium]